MRVALDAPTRSHGATYRFLRHYLEMIAAMLVGMAVFGAAVSLVLAALGHGNVLHFAGLRALVMTMNMTLGMGLWMRYRGHSSAAIGEMAAAMFIPLALLIGPYYAGLISAEALLIWMHALMLPAMLVAMLHRRDEYTAEHHRGARAR